jgi:cytochrome bd-type quinol oxidase subunit 2
MTFIWYATVVYYTPTGDLTSLNFHYPKVLLELKKGGDIMKTFVHSVYTLILALWVGGISLFTFIVTPEIFRSYGRDAAGEIVGKLFPGYFIFTLVLSALALLVLLFCRSHFGKAGYRWSLVLAAIAIAINVFVSFKLYPEITRVKQQVRSFESLAEDSPARKTFRKLHAVSATLNLILLADGVTLLIISTSRKQ